MCIAHVERMEPSGREQAVAAEFLVPPLPRGWLAVLLNLLGSSNASVLGSKIISPQGKPHIRRGQFASNLSQHLS